MEAVKQTLVAVSLWLVLFVTLTPNALRDGRGFYWEEPWTWALAVPLAVCIWGCRELITKARGPRHIE